MVNSGLEGIVAAATRLSHVDGERGELVIAGFHVGDLAEHATFEETTWLLWHGELPSTMQLESFRAELAAARALSPATVALLRECARGESRPDGRAARRGRHDLAPIRRSCRHRRCHSRHGGSVLEIAAGEGSARSATRSGSCGELPLLAERRGARPREGSRPGDLSEHRRRSRAQRLHVHGAGHHLDRVGSRVCCGWSVGGAQGTAPRRRAGARARHGLRDRRRLPGGSDPAPEDRSRREADGIRSPRLQGARPRADVLAKAAERMYTRAGDMSLYRLARSVEETALRLLEEYKPGRRLQTNVEFYTALLLHGLGLDAVAVHPDVCDRSCERMDRTRPRAAAREPHHPPPVGVRRPARSASGYRCRSGSRSRSTPRAVAAGLSARRLYVEVSDRTRPANTCPETRRYAV